MRKRRVAVFSHLLALLAGLTAAAAAARAEKLVDPAELEAWADAYYGRAIAEKRAAGITISVVQDGEVIFAKGYGYSDLTRKIPVDPETSGFIVGSITKTFVATAVGQLMDRGVIASFDDPANKYLKRVQLPGARGAKVTIRQLLNHRAGFEDVDFGFLDKTAKDASIPLSPEEILRFMPELVMEPGGPAVYSNWSFSLLGFLIEDVTGQRLDDYLRENIWEPLGMTHTHLVYERFPENLSLNHVFEKDGTPVPDPPRAPHPWISPAGAIVSTAVDIARYMNAHIYEGEDGGYPLVSPAMFKELHTERFRNSAVSLGFAHAFWTSPLNGAQSIEHGGGAPGFQNMMTMIPEKRFGFYVSAMQGGLASWASYSEAEIAAGEVIVHDPTSGFELRQSFIDRFLEPSEDFDAGPMTDLAKLPGRYWSLRRPFTTIEALGQGFNPAAVLTVELAGDGGGLTLNGSGPYTEIGNGVFVSPTGKAEWTDPYTLNLFAPSHIAFMFDEEGNVTGLIPGMGDQVWAPASAIFNPQTMLMGFFVFGLAALTGALLFLWPQRERFANLTNYLGLAIALGVLVFPYAIMGGFAKGDSLILQMAIGEKGRFWLMVLTANVLVVVTGLLLFGAAREWLAGAHDGVATWAGLGRRLHLGAVALSGLGVLVVLNFFNFLGVNMPG